MYSITLEVNQRCNLKCGYCYLGEKNGARMEPDTGYRAIDFAFEKCIIHKDKKIKIDFIGGESFLDFKIIQDFVNYAEMKNKSFDYQLQFSATTNATIFNREILEYLIEKDFSLKISIDGNKEIHDLNRVTTTGEGSFDKIMENLELVKEYEKRTGKLVQVTNVITLNNYKCYYETLVYLTRELGFKNIDTGIDLEVEWTDEQISELEQSILKSFDYFIESAKQKKGFYWDFASQVVRFKNQRKKFYACGGGIISSYVRTDGSIYACPGYLDPSVQLGNVKKEILQDRVRKLIEFTGIENENCSKCGISQYCLEQSCIMQNLAGTGDINTPLKILCCMRKLMYKVYIENENVIKRLVM